MTSLYEAGVPAHCPPSSSEHKAATLFRICMASTPDAEDYTSHAQSTKKGKKLRAKSALKANPMDCLPCGLSVWLSEEDMRHACAALPFTEGKYIFKSEVSANEGKVQATGANEHHTYWPLASTDLLSRAQLAFGPVIRDNLDVA